ncbi:MAG: dienelactone hydrolase family protein [Nocardioidaceae bacterium]
MQTIEFAAPDGRCEAYLSLPPSGSGPGVLFFADAFGLRPQIARMVERITSWGYVVMAPNIFYRSGSVDELAPKVDLREPGARESVIGSIRPHLSLATTRAEYAYGHACDDASMPPEAVEALGAALAEHGLVGSNEVFPGLHGYTMADTSSYDETSAERHFDTLRALYTRALS